MTDSYITLLRQPDDIKIQTEASSARFEEKRDYIPPEVRLDCKLQNGALAVILYPSDQPVCRLRLRYNGDFSRVRAVKGEYWGAMIPHQPLDDFFFALADTEGGQVLHSYGVKTGGNAFASFCCDPCGITVWLDVRNGTSGVRLKEPLLCAEFVCRQGKSGENAYLAAKEFCGMMCASPKKLTHLPYGMNNWYWAYGNADADSVIDQACYLAALCKDFASPENPPYMVMDDGWQAAHARMQGVYSYNGGPWLPCVDRFPSMQGLADAIHKTGCKAGLWFRPLLTLEHFPKEAALPQKPGGAGFRLDPTHPFTKQKVAADTARIAGWGYDLIKFDFSVSDFLEGHPENITTEHLYDRSVTNAQALKALYTIIAENAGDALVMECDGASQLSAGLFALSRCGGDTSGNLWEVSVRGGVHTFLKLVQNRSYFAADMDCGVFTERVDKGMNFEFLRLAAICGTPTFASVKPGILTSGEEKRLSEIFALAAAHKEEEDAIPMDWTYAASPGEFWYRGEKITFDWFSEYGGSRRYMTFWG